MVMKVMYSFLGQEVKICFNKNHSFPYCCPVLSWLTWLANTLQKTVNSVSFVCHFGEGKYVLTDVTNTVSVRAVGLLGSTYLCVSTLPLFRLLF